MHKTESVQENETYKTPSLSNKNKRPNNGQKTSSSINQQENKNLASSVIFAVPGRK